MLVLLAASVLLTAVVAAVDSPFSDAPLAHRVSYPVVHKLEQLLLSDDKECPTANEVKFRFEIHGWRWHSLALVRYVRKLTVCCRPFSLLALTNAAVNRRDIQKLAHKQRDARRLAKLAHMASSEKEEAAEQVQQSDLSKACDYACNFNMKTLYDIEDDLFYPWLQKTIVRGSNEKDNEQDRDIRKAFGEVMEILRMERQAVKRLCSDILKMSDSGGSEGTEKVMRSAQEMGAIAAEICDLQDRLVVPVVARLVPTNEQSSFNFKVLRKLGILNSRIHLCGMKDAVWESGEEIEKELFNVKIPKIPRLMMPRWHRSLYEPKVGKLEQVKLKRESGNSK